MEEKFHNELNAHIKLSNLYKVRPPAHTLVRLLALEYCLVLTL